jgi:hypothetical protein
MNEQQLLIRLAEDDCAVADANQVSADVSVRSLLVKASLMRSCSTVAEGLPAEAAVWDLSNLLIHGQPVQRNTAVRWLNCCYMRMHEVWYDERLRFVDALSASELFKLLAFADSVESAKGIITACLPTEQQLSTMHMYVTAVNALEPLQQWQQQQLDEQWQLQQQEGEQQQQQQQQDNQNDQEAEQQQEQQEQVLQPPPQPETVPVYMVNSCYCFCEPPDRDDDVVRSGYYF